MAADSKAKFLQDAEKYVLHGKVQQAIGEYLKIIKFDPDDVLILNTVGDLYLRQKNISEAHKYFSRVAESYVRNNFFLKAIAVYKKILSADPNNLEINATMASLYAKQGLSIDAKNQYLKVAALFEKEGNTREVLDIYEKVVDLDPGNAAAQRKLAELYYAAGDDKQSHVYWTGAARAQVKAGDVAGAMDSIRRAIELDPLDVNVLGSLFDCCRQTGDYKPALEQLKKSVQMAPQNLELREMLGQAHLAAGDPASAFKAFQMAFSMDDARYEGIFAVAQDLINRDDCDGAANCLDAIIPILITRRETERAAELFGQILCRHPDHIESLIKMASIYSATGDQPRYMETLDAIAEYYLSIDNPAEAIGYLEKILQLNPESEKHRKLHQQAFSAAYPDTVYTPPAVPSEPAIASGPISVPKELEALPGTTSPEVVEADLLINYGLKEKALKLLQSLEVRDPGNKEMRLRLMHLYKADDKYAEAARQCLLLAALCRLSKNEEAAQGYIAEAKQIAPDMDEYSHDLLEFARLNGIYAEMVEKASAEEPLQSGGEVDLSADLMDIFFTGDQDAAMEDDLSPIPEVPEESTLEAFPEEIQKAPTRSVQEQLQEVDFYIRLGFHDEALAKLNEIAKLNPDSPELASRYQKLDAAAQDGTPGTMETARASGNHGSNVSAEFDSLAMPELSQEWKSDDASSGFAILDPEPGHSEQARDPLPPASFPSAESFSAWNHEEPQVSAVSQLEPDASEFQANEMFADLMEDLGGAASDDVSQESFENHFSLATAYREMELLDESIREFESALKAAHAQKDANKIIQCCGMLSTCFLKKGMARSALRWCQTGLGIADNSSHEAMALRYDMGIAHSMSGSNERALECFDRIFSMDPSYRDVAQRIDELKSGSNKHAP